MKQLTGMDKNLLHKFISNHCTSNEIDSFFNQLKEDSGEQKDKRSVFKSYWNDIKPDKEKDIELEQRRLDKIHHKINLNQSEQKDTRIRVFSSRKSKLTNIIAKAAAILLIPVLTLLIYTRYFQPELYALLGTTPTYEIISPANSRIQFTLPDSTKVWLNQGSKLTYPQHFKNKTRNVKLEGEGYFKVAHNTKKPFIVETNKIAVKAVGTAFDVKAYANNPNIETTLEEGKVILLGNSKQTEICEMKPGEQFIFDTNSNKYTLKAVNPTKYVCWKDGKLIFTDDNLDEVIERLSRWYNIKITLSNPQLKSLTFTATFIDENLEQVLEMMEYIMPISYSVSTRKRLSDGTFSEKEILIHKKGGDY